jgi:CubicO group peptidase (beta-lactamase class C family)
MEYDATWSLDSEHSGLEKTFCCINARARDFAKIGRLYLNKGNWNGTQIVSESWVEQSIKADRTDGGSPNYKYNWWLQEDGSFMAKGVLGQFIFVNPNKNIVIVRLGKSYGNVFWPDLIGTLSREY